MIYGRGILEMYSQLYISYARNYRKQDRAFPSERGDDSGGIGAGGRCDASDDYRPREGKLHAVGSARSAYRAIFSEVRGAIVSHCSTVLIP